jgi:hypothetical protein
MVFAFSLGAGSLAVLQMLSIIVAPGGLAKVGAQRYQFNPGRWITITATAAIRAYAPVSWAMVRVVHSTFLPTGRHIAAERARGDRAARGRLLGVRLARRLDDLAWRLTESAFLTGFSRKRRFVAAPVDALVRDS